ncbi:hypothetical protein EUX98_g5195 [Antrodiella citrinella]|uniref:FAD-binding PCMH-type domain-containing protein n=1 Tax=Antrodiella citrinella TaxID=2447956 RepID=A0A4S4MS35_9APHY|nr:hypothetical protein EUX98_g5195 [Antrodiella citrinella]
MTDISAFRKEFKGELVTSADPGYEEAIARWARNAVKRAQVVAFVKDADDVVAALKYAKDVGLRIAIRGGGHNPSAASSVEDGLVIDLSKFLNGATVDADKKLAYVGGGALWGTVDQETIKHGLATVGGTVNHTGVGGLTLGGGYGYLSGLHGLAIDNVAEVTVVTANGSILKASLTENPDLFYGIRGGGCNFGVVTEALFTPDKLEALAAVLDTWWANIKPEEAIYVVFGRAPPDGTPMIIANLVYHGSEAEGRANFKPIFDVGPVADMTKEIPYEDVNTMQNGIALHGFNYFMKGTFLDKKPSLDMTRTAFNKVMELAQFGVIDVAMGFEYGSNERVNSVPADETPFRRDLPGNGVVLVKWNDDALEKAKYARDAAHALAALTPKLGFAEAYGNYEGIDSDALPKEGAVPADKSQVFFTAAYPKLQALKKKYDPDMVFNKWYPITPAA